MPWYSMLSLGMCMLQFIPVAMAKILRDIMFTVPPMTPAFEYWPREYPSPPEVGWNCTAIRAEGLRVQPEPYETPLFYHDGAPYTTRAGARITSQFYGTGIHFAGWTTNGTQITVRMNDENITEHTTGGQTAMVTQLWPAVGENSWWNLSITLDKGELQLLNITLYKLIEVGNEKSDLGLSTAFPERKVGTTENEDQDVNGYFKVNASSDKDWVVQELWEPGVWDTVRPHIVGEPGANTTFRTWPNASHLQLTVGVGRNAGMASYSIDPPPFGMPAQGFKRNLSQPIESWLQLDPMNLDPKERYTVTVNNLDPTKKLHFQDVNYVFATNLTKVLDWDWRNESIVTSNATGNASRNATNSTVEGIPGALNSSDNNSSNVDAIPSSETKNSSTNVGAIAGGVVGGVFGVAALLAALLFYFRRKHTDDDASIVDATAMADQAYVWPAQPHRRPGDRSRRGSQSSSSSGHRHGGPQETDAGRVRMDTVPPSYDPAWADDDDEPSQSGPSDRPAASDVPILKGETRYMQAKREHSALFSPITRYLRMKREHMNLFSAPASKEPMPHRDPGPLPVKVEESTSIEDEKAASFIGQESPSMKAEQGLSPKGKERQIEL